MLKKVEKSTTLEIQPLKRGMLTLRLIGHTPMYMHSMSAKARRDLLIGGGRKTMAERKEIKHNPEQEFVEAAYFAAGGPTLLCHPGSAIKKIMEDAALVTPQVTKADIGRMVFVPNLYIPIWGIPRLKMDVVRQSNIQKTPDIRTRPYFRRWCTQVDIAFITPQLSDHAIVALMFNGGVVSGLGDNRHGKGAGSYGTFEVLSGEIGTGDDDQEALWEELTTNEGREAQQYAMDNPEPEDMETEELLEMVRDERNRRSATPETKAKKKGRK